MIATKKIGQGAFTTAYRTNRKDRVILKSTDPIKEVMAQGWFPESKLFPKVHFLNNTLNEFQMKLYPRMTAPKKSLIPAHYQLYKELQKVGAWHNVGLNNLRSRFKEYITNPKYRQIMIEATEACANYGTDVAFEISPRNISFTPKGRLILMDCFFIRSRLE